jgi:8-oxo-dGTP pyrophosphatase MutT (NUDIX family)
LTEPARGGPQRIPRPVGSEAGAPPPWADIPLGERVVDLDRLRSVFTGRVGAPSSVELAPPAPLRASAVLAAFYEGDAGLEVLLTRRSWTLRSHTGEVAFPGGACEPGEAPVDAALREAHEETGLDPSSVELLGELDHLMTITSRSFIVPFVALLSGRPVLTASAAEVDALLYVPVAELLRDDVYREERWRFEGRPPWVPADAPVAMVSPGARPIFFFEIVGDTIWGATAAMLRHLLGLALGLPVAIDHA